MGLAALSTEAVEEATKGSWRVASDRPLTLRWRSKKSDSSLAIWMLAASSLVSCANEISVRAVILALAAARSRRRAAFSILSSSTTEVDEGYAATSAARVEPVRQVRKGSGRSRRAARGRETAVLTLGIRLLDDEDLVLDVDLLGLGLSGCLGAGRPAAVAVGEVGRKLAARNLPTRRTERVSLLIYDGTAEARREG
jgi:hypothetical protein